MAHEELADRHSAMLRTHDLLAEALNALERTKDITVPAEVSSQIHGAVNAVHAALRTVERRVEHPEGPKAWR